MKIIWKFLHSFLLLTVSLAISSCTMPSTFYSDGLLQYAPDHPEFTIPAKVTLDIEHKMTQEVRQIWKDFLNTDDTIKNWKEAVRQTIEDDVIDSRVLVRIILNLRLVYL
ncbi:MAG: hypothetical protein ACI9S8_002514 [Chlamydiales bacterium]|jgi:hypothetical protein